VRWQHLGRPVVHTKHGDAPRWLACGWLRSGRRTWIVRDDLFIVSAQKRATSDSGSTLSDGGVKISPLASPAPECTFNRPWQDGGGDVRLSTEIVHARHGCLRASIKKDKPNLVEFSTTSQHRGRPLARRGPVSLARVRVYVLRRVPVRVHVYGRGIGRNSRSPTSEQARTRGGSGRTLYPH
jgi:hypothetical protein